MTVSIDIVNETLEPENFERLCNDFLNLLIELTPVDTGYCADSWSMSVSPTDANFYNSAPYAMYLDQGHSDQAPNGMSQPALAELPSLAAQYS